MGNRSSELAATGFRARYPCISQVSTPHGDGTGLAVPTRQDAGDVESSAPRDAAVARGARPAIVQSKRIQMSGTWMMKNVPEA